MAPRTVLLVIGVLLLQLGFILSYVGAFHSPKPHEIPMAVVAPQQVSGQLVQQYNAAPGDPIAATAMPEQQAREALRKGETDAVLIINPQGTQDTLLVATGGGSSVAEAVETIVQQGQATQQRTVTVQDEIPLQPGDSRGLTGFYLVIGWLVGGYLMASLLGVASGSRPANMRRAGFRLGASALYAIASGLGGALIVDQALNALTGHFMALWWLGALVVFAAATVTIAFQTLLGVVGIGVTVLIFVILGNPSAGGAYQSQLLPPFWRGISEALPNGAGTAAVRKIIYFGSHNIAGNIWVLAIWAAAGLAVTLVGAGVLQRRAHRRAERRAAKAAEHTSAGTAVTA
ncbi:DUF3533 domain-containing protein [Nakamurella sp. DB0629]|uniref:DUF3533 domain-containing protein n=1 Tax=Nakamurella aerolata TaxID=1656892 RepID=A0A849AIT2_9ACTN|nr:DUF3533 domain-containing protein [Nakamurella aerolata]